MFQFSGGLIKIKLVIFTVFKYSNNEFHLCFKYFNDHEYHFRSGRVYSEE